MAADRKPAPMPGRVAFSRGRRSRPREDFPWTVEVRHAPPDPFAYRVHARNATDAAQVVARYRALGRGARIEDVNA